MPELPEVEVICRYLKTKICNKKINKIDIFLSRMIKNTKAEDLHYIEGQAFSDIRRRGKYIVLECTNGAVLLVHLRMTGRLVYNDAEKITCDTHERVRFTFDDGSYLAYGDTRTLGAIYFFKQAAEIDIKGYLELGVEPLTPNFTPQICYELMSKNKSNIKSFLLNQKYITGLGNIYVDEALFASKILPTRTANSLNFKECEELTSNIKRLLTESIGRGGTTFRDYRNGEGTKGRNQDYLMVYGRGKENCLICHNKLQSKTIAGRTTVFCDKCQK